METHDGKGDSGTQPNGLKDDPEFQELRAILAGLPPDRQIAAGELLKEQNPELKVFEPDEPQTETNPDPAAGSPENGHP